MKQYRLVHESNFMGKGERYSIEELSTTINPDGNWVYVSGSITTDQVAARKQLSALRYGAPNVRTVLED
jgi:hypothetical protein